MTQSNAPYWNVREVLLQQLDAKWSYTEILQLTQLKLLFVQRSGKLSYSDHETTGHCCNILFLLLTFVAMAAYVCQSAWLNLQHSDGASILVLHNQNIMDFHSLERAKFLIFLENALGGFC
jgi:hypothetical protein